MAAELQFSLTELGYKTLINKGLVDTLTHYSLGDFDHNYTIKNATNNILAKITGYHNETTKTECGKSKYEGMFPTEPTTEEILNTRSRVQTIFNRVDCDYEFNEPSIQLKINLNTWLNDLSNISTYSYDMTEHLTLDLWSYISILNQRIDLTTNDYKTYDTITDCGFIYTPMTTEDLKLFNILSPKYMKSAENGQKYLYNQTGLRYNSPLLLTFSTNSVNGNTVHGTRGLLSLVPNEWGYYCDGQFLTIETVENTDSNNFPWESIYPAVKIGNGIYVLKSNDSFLTKNRLIGYLYNMVGVTDNTTTALQGLIDYAKLFFKTYGSQMPDGSYQTKINFNVYVKSDKTDNINEVVGNIFGITLSYNPSDTTSQIIQLI
jgi:hypothetical protein